MYLYGASGHAKVIIEILELCGIKVKGLFDDNPQIKNILDYKVVGAYNSSILNNDQLIISIGNNELRKKISEKLNPAFGKAIHPSAIISKSSLIGNGSVIMGNAIINSDTKIGNHAIINTSASIDHDCKIEDFVHISPNATLCGGVFIGEGTNVGAAAVIIPGINIGKWATIGAGAVVIKDVPDYVTVVGNPAIIKRSV
jgi:sugar O-acyltransferase (sialic acid O-acetyltransferase NeuD family)